MFTAALRRQATRTAARSARWSSTSSSTASSSASSSFSSAGKYLRYASLASTIAVSAYTVGSLYPPTLATYLSPRIAPPPPDPNDPSSIAYVESLEESLHNLPLLNEHRTRDDSHEWYETRPYINLPPERRANSLTAGALRGPGKLAFPPLVRARRDEKESMLILHLGTGLCGHEGIVHGGMLATLLDESLARTALLNLPEKVGVTANLNLNYRAPTKADQFIVIRTRLIEVNGRKSKVAGTVEDLEGNVLVEASALFVQPRYAKLLNTKAIEDIMGAQPPPHPSEAAPVPAPLPATPTVAVEA